MIALDTPGPNPGSKLENFVWKIKDFYPKNGPNWLSLSFEIALRRACGHLVPPKCSKHISRVPHMRRLSIVDRKSVKLTIDGGLYPQIALFSHTGALYNYALWILVLAKLRRVGAPTFDSDPERRHHELYLCIHVLKIFGTFCLWHCIWTVCTWNPSLWYVLRTLAEAYFTR